MSVFQKIGIVCLLVMVLLLSITIISVEFFDGLRVMEKVAPIVILIVLQVVVVAMAIDICRDKNNTTNGNT